MQAARSARSCPWRSPTASGCTPCCCPRSSPPPSCSPALCALWRGGHPRRRHRRRALRVLLGRVYVPPAAPTPIRPRCVAEGNPALSLYGPRADMSLIPPLLGTLCTDLNLSELGYMRRPPPSRSPVRAHIFAFIHIPPPHPTSRLPPLISAPPSCTVTLPGLALCTRRAAQPADGPRILDCGYVHASGHARLRGAALQRVRRPRLVGAPSSSPGCVLLLPSLLPFPSGASSVPSADARSALCTCPDAPTPITRCASWPGSCAWPSRGRCSCAGWRMRDRRVAAGSV